MASNHISIGSSATRQADRARQLIDSVRSVSNLATELLAIYTTYLGDNPDLTLATTYADLAVALGLVGAGANADAKKFYNLLVAAQGRLVGTQISNFVDQLG